MEIIFNFKSWSALGGWKLTNSSIIYARFMLITEWFYNLDIIVAPSFVSKLEFMKNDDTDIHSPKSSTNRRNQVLAVFIYSILNHSI